eukprot:354751-Chlamydomonas_euryale.AAC.4
MQVQAASRQADADSFQAAPHGGMAAGTAEERAQGSPWLVLNGWRQLLGRCRLLARRCHWQTSNPQPAVRAPRPPFASPQHRWRRLCFQSGRAEEAFPSEAPPLQFSLPPGERSAASSLRHAPERLRHAGVLAC